KLVQVLISSLHFTQPNFQTKLNLKMIKALVSDCDGRCRFTRRVDSSSSLISELYSYLPLQIVLMLVAVAIAAPQFYQNGWTDGPNNGVGPVVYAHAP